MPEIEKLKFLSEEQARTISNHFKTPVFVYSERCLEVQAERALNFPNAFGLTVRYAMKANPNAAILKIFDRKGIHIDASSGYEAKRALMAGIMPENILLTSQQIPSDLWELVEQRVSYNACSLHQLEVYANHFPNSRVSVRINPGLGSGGINRTNTGGEGSSFGIWHEQIGEVFDIATRHGLDIERVHTHIGSGSDPEVWKRVALISLGIVGKFIDAGHDVSVLNLGGGYKVGRMSYEKSTDLQECGKPVEQAFRDFADKTGRELRLEIEPGTFLVANGGSLIAEVIDIKSTQKYNFVIINSGMTEVTRPALYGAQHPIVIVPIGRKEQETRKYIVSGHCCESGDILTPAQGDSEALMPRELLRAEIGDLAVIEGAGAYCSGMCTKNYNSYPEAAELLMDNNGAVKTIRDRQRLEQIIRNERDI